MSKKFAKILGSMEFLALEWKSFAGSQNPVMTVESLAIHVLRKMQKNVIIFVFQSLLSRFAKRKNQTLVKIAKSKNKSIFI